MIPISPCTLRCIERNEIPDYHPGHRRSRPEDIFVALRTGKSNTVTSFSGNIPTQQPVSREGQVTLAIPDSHHKLSFLASSGVPLVGSPRQSRDRRDRQEKLTLRLTIQRARLGTNPALPRDGCPGRGASACAARGKSILIALASRFRLR